MTQLHLGDCLRVLPTLPDKSVDMVCADPPYGTTECKWDSAIPLEPLWSELRRIIKPRGAVVMTAAQPFTSVLVLSNRRWFKYDWVWRKNVHSNGACAPGQPLKVHESVLVFSEGKCGNGAKEKMTYHPQGVVEVNKLCRRLDGGERKNHHPGRRAVIRKYIQKFSGYPKSVLDIPRDGAITARLHPTQKPVALMEYLIRTYTNEGETVLDFCFGSGTTLLAALRCGRKAIGIESDPGYFATARSRIAAAQASTPLFQESADV